MSVTLSNYKVNPNFNKLGNTNFYFYANVVGSVLKLDHSNNHIIIVYGGYTLSISNQNVKIENKDIGSRRFYFTSKHDKFVLTNDMSILNSLTEFSFRDIYIRDKLKNLFSFDYKDVQELDRQTYRIDDTKLFVDDAKNYASTMLAVVMTQEKSNLNDLVDTFNESVIASISNYKNLPKIMLSLSGGIDSRLLFSSFIKQGVSFDAFTFGSAGSPDFIVSNEICKKFGVKHHHYDSLSTDDGTVVRDVITMSSYGFNSTPAYAAVRRNRLHEVGGDSLILTGGFGEIFRSRYFYKVKLLSRLTNDYSVYLFKSHWSDNQSEVSFFETFKNKFDSITISNSYDKIDLYTLLTRVPYFGSPEQHRLDTLCHSSMVYLNEDFLCNMMASSSKNRSSNTFVSTLLKKNQMSLFPIVVKNQIAKEYTDYYLYNLGLKKSQNRDDSVLENKKRVFEAFKSVSDQLYSALLNSDFDNKEYINIAKQYRDGLIREDDNRSIDIMIQLIGLFAFTIQGT
jgi:hypothetical protein